MKQENYRWLAEMLLEKSGLVLGDKKDYLLNARLPPLLEGAGATDLDDLVEQLKRTRNTQLADSVVEALTTNETSFFRSRKDFDVIYDTLVPKLMETRRTRRTLRFWSAGCSTGQEPYSVLMGLYERFPELTSWNVEMLATDLSREVLQRAKEGSYSHLEVQRGLPVDLLMKYFSQKGQRYVLRPSLASQVTFQVHNLTSRSFYFSPFDVVFCRNVLIYFDVATKRGILERLATVLASDGYLFLGTAETTVGVTDRIARLPGADVNVYTLSNQPPPSAKTGEVKESADLAE